MRRLSALFYAALVSCVGLDLTAGAPVAPLQMMLPVVCFSEANGAVMEFLAPDGTAMAVGRLREPMPTGAPRGKWFIQESKVPVLRRLDPAVDRWFDFGSHRIVWIGERWIEVWARGSATGKKRKQSSNL